MKTCRRCGATKDRGDFYFANKANGYLSSWCKACSARHQSKTHRAYYLANCDKIRKYQAAYRVKNKFKAAAYKKIYAKNNSHKIRKYLYDNRAKIAARARVRLKSDGLFSTAKYLRERIRIAFLGRSWSRNGQSKDLLGATFDVVVAHLESKFKPGMSWKKRSLWHIDHIVPLASAKTPEVLKALCHYKNLQPLWASENLRKSAKMPIAATLPSDVDSMTMTGANR